MKMKFFLLGLIVILAFILRFYQLGKTPIGLEWDEVAIGYDSYSVLKTGSDQYGKFLPTTFRSIDDYKPPLYEYLSIPSITLFGLNAFSVRFPSALLGTITVFITYFLVRELLRGSSLQEINKTNIALLSSLLLSISPWHLQFSRAAFEVNLGVFLVVSMVTFFLYGLRNSKFLVLAALIAGLGFYSYHSVRVVMPILLFCLAVTHLYKIIPSKKKMVIAGIVFLGFFLPFIPSIFSPEAQMRLRVTNVSNIFNDLATVKQNEIIKEADQQKKDSGINNLFHRPKLVLGKIILANYLSHFNPDFLFVKGDVPLHHAPDFGLLYIVEAPLLGLGWLFYFKKYLNKNSSILAVWFLVAPFPAAVTLQVPHAVRTELILPTMQIFTAIGIFELTILAKKYLPKLLFFGTAFLVSLYMFNIALYLHQYYVHLNFELSDKWFYGRQEAALWSEKRKSKYQKIVVSTRLEQPVFFWLFYLKYDPSTYLREGGTVSGGWAEEGNHFDKYEFRQINYTQDRKEKGLLLIGTPGDFPQGINTLKMIKYLDGHPGILFVST